MNPKKQNDELSLKTSPLFTKNLEAYMTGYRIILNVGGSGSGKSYSILTLLLYIVLNSEQKTIDICRRTFPTVKGTVLDDWLKILTDYKIMNLFDYNMTDSIFTYKKTGTQIRFYSLDDAIKLRGKKRDIIFIDEANENDFETYTQLSMRTNETIFLAINPSEDEEHWIYRVTADKKKCVTFHSTHLDNPFLPELRRQEILDLVKVDYNYYLVYCLGLPPKNNVRIYNHFQKYIEKPANISSTVYGLDFGFNHVTSLCEVNWVGKKVYAKELIYEDKLTIEDIIDKLAKLEISKEAKIYADSAAPAFIESIKRAGYNIAPANKAVLAGIDFIKSSEVYIHLDSLNAWKEAKAYSWIVNGEKITDEPNKKMDMDNFLDALRYAVYSSKKTLSGNWSTEYLFI
jgi:phage terminase large subunit